MKDNNKVNLLNYTGKDITLLKCIDRDLDDGIMKFIEVHYKEIVHDKTRLKVTDDDVQTFKKLKLPVQGYVTLDVQKRNKIQLNKEKSEVILYDPVELPDPENNTLFIVEDYDMLDIIKSGTGRTDFVALGFPIYRVDNKGEDILLGYMKLASLKEQKGDKSNGN